MPKITNYTRGVRYERIAKKALEADGWIVMRTAGSHGPYDIIGLHPELDEAIFLQIKATKGGQRAVEALIRDFKATLPVHGTRRIMQGIWVWSKGKWHVWLD